MDNKNIQGEEIITCLLLKQIIFLATAIWKIVREKRLFCSILRAVPSKTSKTI